jgi:hypothetical protein
LNKGTKMIQNILKYSCKYYSLTQIKMKLMYLISVYEQIIVLYISMV